jgi:superfamily II DNA/RNA helicase
MYYRTLYYVLSDGIGPAQAHNGSGKTTCFVLAMLSRVDPALAQPQALCVCPTRELVVQNLQVLERMGRHAGITATSTAAADFEVTRCARKRRGRSGRSTGPRQSCRVGACWHLRCRLRGGAKLQLPRAR